MTDRDAADPLAAHRDDHHTRAVRFFWTVLIMASAASIAGNAVHATLNATTVPPWVAAAVATAPPLVLLGSTEGVSLLLRARQHGSALYWCALAMTALLAICAFVLSFDALRDLAVRSGVHEQLAWLWPIAVDVTIAQATVSLLALSRGQSAVTIEHPVKDSGHAQVVGAITNGPLLADVAAEDLSGEPSSATPILAHSRVTAAVALVEDKITKQSPEIVAAVLERHARGEKVSKIAAALDVHHSTVRRLVAAHQQRIRACV